MEEEEDVYDTQPGGGEKWRGGEGPFHTEPARSYLQYYTTTVLTTTRTGQDKTRQDKANNNRPMKQQTEVKVG